MASSVTYGASAGGVSVGADGTLNMTDTLMLGNQAGGVGRAELVFAEQAQAGRMERAQHVLCVGKAVIERC